MKKVEDDDSAEISEPEDPLMLQRDAKDWKVCFSIPVAKYHGVRDRELTPRPVHRDKTTMPSWASLNTGTALQKTRSNARTVRRSSVITQTRKLPLVTRRMTPSSNASRRPPRCSWTPSAAVNSTP